jgi:hypothetical protein
MSKPNISILLPSRGRTAMLKRSISSLLDLADHPESVEFLMAFDDDDAESSAYFISDVVPLIEKVGGTYSVLEFSRMGYGRLHEYLNSIAPYAQADWWVFWNDDAVMLDQGWDTVIISQGDRFCVQAFDTHKLHPYSIFPIMPRAWFDTLGYLSKHPLNDAYISQIAWMMDIMVRIPVKVSHERFDLTGQNKDQTFEDRVIYEGNIHDPKDFNHVSCRQLRVNNAERLAEYLRGRGYDMSYWEQVSAGKLDPWTKMLASDVNNQVSRVPMPRLRS